MKVRPVDRSAFEARRLLPVARAVAPVFPSAESLSSSPRIRISPGRESRMRSEVLCHAGGPWRALLPFSRRSGPPGRRL
eukprot:2739314-Amphidinium_carterae.1